MPGALQVPVGLLVERPRLDRAGLGRDVRVEMGGDLGGDLHRARRVELQLAARFAGRRVVDPEVDQVAVAVADIRPALLDPLAPLVEVELAVVELDVDPAQADALAVDAGEVGLAADLGPVAAVERVIPDVELPRGRRVDARDEVDRVVDHVDDVFVGADAVERRDLVRTAACRPEIFSPQPECEKPTTPPCDLPHLSTGRSQLGHSSIRVVPG